MPNPQIKDFITKAQASGKTKDEIYRDLLVAGWPLDVIDASYRGVNKIEESTADAVTEPESKVAVQKNTTNILVVIGAILVGLGIFSFIAANWRGMDEIMKVTIILFFMNLSYWSGYYLKHSKDLVKTGNALILLGTIIYGAGIFLIGQIFHIRASWADGFIYWMFGVWVVAWAESMSSLLFYSFVLGVISVIGFPFIATGYMSERYSLGISAFVLFIAAVIAFQIAQSQRRTLPEDLAKLF